MPKSIDARRHPLGCCFFGFFQAAFRARGQSFTYGLEDIGRYYRDYVELMAHFDAVLPGSGCIGFSMKAMIDDHRDRSAAICSSIAACRSRTGA